VSKARRALHPADEKKYSAQLLDDVRRLSEMRQTGVSMKSLLEFGQKPTAERLVTACVFLHHELPIRLAHRVKDLADLPYGLSDMPSVRKVSDWYMKSLDELRSVPRPKDTADERRFTELIHGIYERHAGTLMTMARGVHELKNHLKARGGGEAAGDGDLTGLKDIHEFLDRFYMSRIGIRILIGQHVALREQAPGWVGLICEKTNAQEVALTAIDTARHMCERHYGIAPEVTLHGRKSLAFPYVPSHLHHMLFELIKNSMRAVVDFHGVDADMPPIRVIVSDGEHNEDVCIKVSDEGGGIARSAVGRIFSYTYTTASADAFRLLDSENASDFGGESPLAGLGYGLPISRLFARYFGGDLSIKSMEGYGTDAYLHLKRVGDFSEPLP